MSTRMKWSWLACLSMFGIVLQAWAQAPQRSAPADAEIEKLISKMSIAQKVGQMTQINIDVISKGAIYQLEEPHTLDMAKLDTAINRYFVGSVLNAGGHTYTREHWHEIIGQIQQKASKEGSKIPILYGIDAIHGVNYTVGATLFPQEIGQAATWNPELIQKGAAICAYECRASGIPWNFSPVLDLGRQPLWSRFFETYGEDVHLARKMAEACVKGYQGTDPSQTDKVAACLKHFLGYSMPLSGKDRTPAWIPERQLREYFLPTFEAAIQQGALSIMVNSGEINGVAVHASHEILTDLLRGELGFEGVVLTDWEDIIKLHRDHHVAADMREAVKMAVLAGIDMSMTPNDYSFNEALIDLVKTGEIPESRLDESVRRILKMKQGLGILKNGLWDLNKYPKFGSEEHRQAALTTALESITLLKNQDGLLPLARESKLLIIGPAANSLNYQNGAWTHTWQGLDPAYNTAGALTYHAAIQAKCKGKVQLLEAPEKVSDAELKSMAAAADVVVVCLGEKPSTEKPGDIDELDLPADQVELVKRMQQLGKPVVLVFTFNRPLIVREVEPLASSILHAYLPGDQGGEALAAILFGEVSPSGKLPFTYPRYSGSIIPYDHKYTEKLDPNFGPNAFQPQWEFGHGLSYADLRIVKAQLDKQQYGKQDIMVLKATVRNNSDLDAKEVLQVYVSDLVASITPSVKRLRAFQKLNVPAQSEVQVELKIPVAELAFVGLDNKWLVESGQFRMSVGTHLLDFEVK